jgi:hypothetical protein
VEGITEDILAAGMEGFSRSLQMVRFEVLMKMSPENDEYSSASNDVILFVYVF